MPTKRSSVTLIPVPNTADPTRGRAADTQSPLENRGKLTPGHTQGRGEAGRAAASLTAWPWLQPLDSAQEQTPLTRTTSEEDVLLPDNEPAQEQR